MGQHHESPINQGAQLSVMGDTFMGVLAQDRIRQSKSGHSPFHSAVVVVFYLLGCPGPPFWISLLEVLD